MNLYDSYISGTLTVSGAIVPTANIAFDLGTTSNQWRHLYVGSGSVYMGGNRVLGLNNDGSIQLGLQTVQTSASLATYTATGGTATNAFTGAFYISGSLNVSNNLIVTGSITAQQYIISSSVSYLTESFASGSHKFGDSSDDTHQFTGSIFLNGSIVTTATGSIGTYTTPTSGGTILTAVGSGSATSAQVFTTTNHASFFEANTNSGSIVTRLQSQNASFVGTMTNNTFDIVAGGNVVIHATGSGLVGINMTKTPNATLDVNGNTIVSGSLTTTGNMNLTGSLTIGNNNPSTTQLNVFTSSVSTQNVMTEFYNNDYTSGTRNFLRVRNQISAGSSMSSYFGQGQDGKTYIVANDFTKNHIVIDGNSTYVGINKNTPNAQLDVNGSAILTGSLTVSTSTGCVTQITGLGGGSAQIKTTSGALGISGYNEIDFNINTTQYAYLNTTGLNLTGSIVTSGPITGNILHSTSVGSTQIFLESSAGGSNRNWQIQTNELAAGDISIMASTAAGGATYSRMLNITSAGNATLTGTFTENSSIRYKDNIETVKYGLDKVLQMRGVTYTKKDTGLQELGLIAEEINEILPEVVLKNEEGEPDSVSYGRITAVLIEAIKEQQKQIEELKALIK